VAGSCEYGDEPSGSGATELDRWGGGVKRAGHLASLCLHGIVIFKQTYIK
jgi:hypothetical protein